MNISHRWVRVNKKRPCPICRKSDWCAYTINGRLARCQRVEAGSYKTGTDKNGQTYYLHRLSGEQRPPIDLPPPVNGTTRRADADALHAVYDALLGGLSLSAAHRDSLRHRGLSDSEIERRLYRSLPIQGRARMARELAERFGTETLLTVPGFYIKGKDGKRWLTIAGAAGLLVPVRDAAGRIAALKVRRDDAGDGPRYSYLSSAKCGGPSAENAVHVPLGIREPVAAVRLTEGELKGDVATVLSSTATISVPGVASWKTAIPVLQQLGTKTVLIAFDADAADKPTVARSLATCVEGLAAEGFAVAVERWPAEHKGIDDLLAAGKMPEVLSGDAARAYVASTLATATAGEPPPPPDPLERLDAVLADGTEKLFRDAELLKALAALAENDPSEFACKRARLKSAGISLRDLDRSIAPYRQSLRAERPPLTAAGEYKVSGGRIVHIRPTKDGPVESPLCNFAARIVEQATADDGAERSVRLAVEGQLIDGTPLPRVEIPAEEFGRMEWIIPCWGTRAVVNAGRATADHLRVAMQQLSGDVPHRTVYGHLGWRRLGECWAYLHAAGAIGENGPVDGIEVMPPDVLARYQLPAPPSGELLQRVVRASLALLDYGPPRLTFPLLASVYRAVLGPCDFAVHLTGESGAFKSEYAALLQQHFGAGMVRLHLPASWASTGNALESTAFACKDAVLTVDDFAPQGGAADVARLHREAERLLRAQGNAAGRQRMRADGSLRPAKPPRGLILSTGEDTPRGQSLRARLLILEVSKGDFGPPPPAANPALTARQRDAAEGLYAASMAGFVRWLSGRYEDVRGRLSAERAELRDRAAGDRQHARTPGILADLGIGLRYLLAYAVEVGAIDEARSRELWERGWLALGEAGDAQAGHIESAEPTGHFLRLLGAALASGRAHLAAPDGGCPVTPSAWGWRREDTRDGPVWRPQGRRAGWIDGDAVLLEPEASYAAAQEMAGGMGESLTVSAQTLRRRLRERGLLASTDDKRETLTIRRVVEGVSRNVLHMNSPLLCTKPDKPDIDSANAGEMSGFECRVDCRESQNPTINPTSDPTANAEGNGQNVGFVGLEAGRDTHAEKNKSGRTWYAPGETAESTRTPFDADGDATPSTPPGCRAGSVRRQQGRRVAWERGNLT